MSALAPIRVKPFLTAVVLVIALVAAACAPAATPTPTPAPTTAPTTAPMDEPTEVPTEEPTEEVDAVATILADETEEAADADADADATEVAGDESDATEEPADADADATEAAGDDTGADTDDSAAGEGEPGVVGVTTTRVRAEPSSRGEVLVEIPRDTPVIALGQTADNGYLFIQLEDGTEGWVSKQTINLDDRFAQLETITP